MATTYTWSYDQIERVLLEDSLADVIQTIHWRITGVDGDFYDTRYGSVALWRPDATDFTAFADVTQDQVKAWVLEGLEEQDDTEASLQTGIQESIDIQQTPTTATGNPANWD
jgi:hypothetical protein|tara:strand:+ start:3584 stop:3919 length:336 start_codon:yes stop_codon:yes gene_type:complete